MNTTTYVVGGMSCAACVNSIEKTLNKFDTIDSVKVNLLKGEMQAKVSSKQLKDWVLPYTLKEKFL